MVNLLVLALVRLEYMVVTVYYASNSKQECYFLQLVLEILLKKIAYFDKLMKN